MSTINNSRELQELKNLGNTSINWLRAVGINSHEDLRKVGPVEAYTKIKTRGFRVSKVLLYALYGALVDTHWNELEPHLKTRLLNEAEVKLEQVNHPHMRAQEFSGRQLSS